jgi:CRISPR/Cas system CMR-associated protein Cmr5 small subunit
VYHTWRNNSESNPKQKIGASVREVKNKLVELEKQVSMNVRLKKEMGVNSIDYWKNTHKALKGISERLIKLANRIGQLY